MITKITIKCHESEVHDQVQALKEIYKIKILTKIKSTFGSSIVKLVMHARLKNEKDKFMYPRSKQDVLNRGLS